MSGRVVVQWEACHPLGEQAIQTQDGKGFTRRKVLGFVWPAKRRWFAQDGAGHRLGSFRTQARGRVVQGQVLTGAPMLVRSKG